MTDLNSVFKTDLVDDHLAAHMNALIGAVLRAEYTNTETISATRELSDADFQMQVITCSGGSRTIELPPEASTNHVHIIYNTSPSNTLVVKDDSGTTTFITLAADEWVLCIPVNGETWKIIENRSTLKTYFDTLYQTLPTTPIQIEGLKVTWNSATSVTVGVGRCYAENGNFINVTSALVKSSLSLSASTWYHIYVYLSGGTPTAEVVTTAPVAWKGTAYSKTGDTSRRYVGSIRTDGSSNVYEFAHNPFDNLMLYSGDSDLDASPFRALSSGTATTATAVDLSAVIPVTSRIGFLRISSSASVVAFFGPTSNVNGLALNIGSTAVQNAIGSFPLTASQQHYYKFNSAPAGGATIDVYGYYFER